MYNQEFDDAALDRELSLEQRNRTRYLRNSKAVRTSKETYALWASVWERQGGSEIVSYSDFYHTPRVTILDGALKGSVMSYEAALKAGVPEELIEVDSLENGYSSSWDDWMPTTAASNIPKGYGANALSLFILPELVGEPIPTHGDSRKGWEWGHTKVFTLVHDSEAPFGLRAWTNQDRVSFSRDIMHMVWSHSLEELVYLLMNKTGFQEVTSSDASTKGTTKTLGLGKV